MQHNRTRVSPAEAAVINASMEPPKKRKVPMALNPLTFDHAVGLGNEEKIHPALDSARRAYAGYAQTLDNVFEREITVRSDKTRTPDDHALRVSRLAMDSMEPVAKRAQSALDGLNAEIGQIDAKIRHETRSRMTPLEQQEVRSYIRSLSDEKRREFLAKADSDSMSAIVAAKPYLSGLSEADALRVNHEWHRREFPDMTALRNKLERARDTLNQGFEKYMGTVSELRDPKANDMERQQQAADEAVKAAFHIDE